MTGDLRLSLEHRQTLEAALAQHVTRMEQRAAEARADRRMGIEDDCDPPDPFWLAAEARRARDLIGWLRVTDVTS